VPAIIKDKTNPFFKSKYSDLASVINGVSETLTSCELAIIHKIKVDAGRNILCTILIHSSGESIESEMVMPEQNDPQKMGSLITYLKRYSYMAILGIASEDEDDDANKASHPKTIEEVSQRFKEFPASEKQMELIKSLCEQIGEKVPVVNDAKHASRIIERLNELKKERSSKSVKDAKFKLE
jgi:hypothetical protein